MAVPTVDYYSGMSAPHSFHTALDNNISWSMDPTLASGVNGSMEDASGARADCTKFHLVFNGVIIGFLCVMGLAGNTLSAMVLQKDQANRVAAFLLQCLALADSFVLLISLLVLVIFMGWVPFVSPESLVARRARFYLVVYVQPFGYIAQSLAIWTTVLVAINRYIAVCCPFIAYRLCTMKKALIQVAIVVSVSIAFNIPRFFQYQIVSRNGTQTGIGVRHTSIGEQTLFGIVYTNALYTVLVLVLPLLLLLVLNTRIIGEMRTLSKRHSSLPHDGEEARGEKNITMVMVIIVIAFLICHTPDRVLQIMKNFYPPITCGSVSYYVSNVCNLLIIFNSSTNFFIYYFFRKRFRRILYKQLCSLCSWTKCQSRAGNSKFPSLMKRASLTMTTTEV